MEHYKLVLNKVIKHEIKSIGMVNHPVTSLKQCMRLNNAKLEYRTISLSG
jgi:hypothetical protein